MHYHELFNKQAAAKASLQGERLGWRDRGKA